MPERSRAWPLPVGVAVAIAIAAVLAAPSRAPGDVTVAAQPSPTDATVTPSAPVPEAATPTPAAAPTAVASRPPPTESGIAIPTVDTEPARLDQQDTDAIAAPTALSLPALGVEAPVVAVGVVDATAEMQVPPDAATAAWYRHGPAPGERGSAVIAAHVDYDGVRGVFHDLEDLEPGDEVEVELADGAATTFRVEQVDSYLKPELPTKELFARGGEPMLTLITCGGRFDPQARSYESNVVVRAVRA